MPETSLVIGGTGVVGSTIVAALRTEDEQVYSLTRRGGSSRFEIVSDIREVGTASLPHISTVYATTRIALLRPALPALAEAGAKRIVAFSSSSVISKANSESEEERRYVKQTLLDEQHLLAFCESRGIAWTILRPSIIYCEGRDANITRIAQIIRRFHSFPLYGSGKGLRQPVHADDLAHGAILASRSAATCNQIYELPGGEILTYCEMVGRIFDGLGKPRVLLHIPPFLWRVAFKAAKPWFANVNIEMGKRMIKDMTYDDAKAKSDFGWSPRSFTPIFGDRTA